MLRQILFLSIVSLLISHFSWAQTACPFSAEACQSLAQARCQLQHEQWKCDDGDEYEFDEGLWRTKQIEILSQILPTLPDHSSRASLQTELDQIRLTGLWKSGEAVLSVHRSGNVKVGIQAWWRDSQGGSTGFWFPVEATYQGDQLDWGAGRYGQGVLEADLRVVKGDGAQVRLELQPDGNLKAFLFAENQWGSATQMSGLFQRQDQGDFGEAKKGFHEKFMKDGFNGVWVGELDVQDCVSSYYPPGRNPYQINLKFDPLKLEIQIQGLWKPQKPETVYHQYWDMDYYRFTARPNTVYEFTETRIRMQSKSEQFGASSDWLFEMSSDHQSMTMALDSSMFGSALGCRIRGSFNKLK